MLTLESASFALGGHAESLGKPGKNTKSAAPLRLGDAASHGGGR
jgi:hypothetical protein